VYDATGKADPDVVLWRGVSGDENITVITEDAFRTALSKYEKMSGSVKVVWTGVAVPAFFVLWCYLKGSP
jgi:hypothetical protein